MKQIILASVLVAAASGANSMTISNLSEADGTLGLVAFETDFGTADYGAFGQVVTTDGGWLSSFSFILNDSEIPGGFSPVTYQASVSRWNDMSSGSDMGGSLGETLWTGSETTSTASRETRDVGKTIYVSTANVDGDVWLEAGTYAFVFQSLESSEGLNGPAGWGIVSCAGDGCDETAADYITESDGYTGGYFIYKPFEGDDVDDREFKGLDLDSAFEVVLRERDVPAVPVSPALPLLGSGLVILGFAASRRRR